MARKRQLTVGDPSRSDIDRFLRGRHPEADDFDREAAIYWFASDYHGGQSSNLYSVLSRSEFRPGPTHRSVSDEGDMAKVVYDSLRSHFSDRRYGERSRTMKDTRQNPALPKVGTPIVGYSSGPGRITDSKGKFTGWVESRTVETYNAGEAWQWQKARAVVVEFHPSTRSRPYYGAGLSLGSGMLFRGEVVGYSLDDAKRQAKVEAEHWLERDNGAVDDDEDADD